MNSADSLGGWDFKVENDEEHIPFYAINVFPIKKRSSKSAGKGKRV